MLRRIPPRRIPPPRATRRIPPRRATRRLPAAPRRRALAALVVWLRNERALFGDRVIVPPSLSWKSPP